MTATGFFVGQPNGNDANAMASWKANMDAATALLGRPVAINTFEAGVGNNPGTTFYSVQQAGGYAPPLIVDGVPMRHGAAALAATIAGQDDAYYAAIPQAAGRYGIKNLDLRLGYEMNLSSMTSGVSNLQDAAAWVQAFQRIAPLMRAAAKAAGVTLRIVWNPLAIGWNAVSPKLCWPGPSFVDLIGTDNYSPIQDPGQYYDFASLAKVDPSWKPVSQADWINDLANRVEAWTYTSGNYWNPTGDGSDATMAGPTQGWSIVEAAAFAKAQGKPICIPESGCGLKKGMLGVADDAAFPVWLAAQLAASGVQCEYVLAWLTDQSDGAWGCLNGEQPKVAAAWAAGFKPAAAVVHATFDGPVTIDGQAVAAGVPVAVTAGSHMVQLTA